MYMLLSSGASALLGYGSGQDASPYLGIWVLLVTILIIATCVSPVVYKLFARFLRLRKKSK